MRLAQRFGADSCRWLGVACPLRHLGALRPEVNGEESHLVRCERDRVVEQFAGGHVVAGAGSDGRGRRAPQRLSGDALARCGVSAPVSIQTFGEPTADVLATMRRLAGDGVPVSIKRPFAGFDRLPQPATTT
jgi:hypothetical protein